MRDWLKTYGWLAGACLTAGWITHELRFHRTFLMFFALGGTIISVGILSIIFPVLNRAFKWAKQFAVQVISNSRRIYVFVRAKLNAALAYVIRPAVETIVAKMIDDLELLKATNWFAHQKQYFEPQRADLLSLRNEGYCPVRIVFSCSSTSPYWRAGLLLTESDYDPSQKSIFGGWLIHLASDGYDQAVHLYVYEGTKLVKHEVGPQSRGSHRLDVRFTMSLPVGDLNTAIITADGFETCAVSGMHMSDCLARPFLIAWADGRDFRVRFEGIRVRWVSHDFPADRQT